MDTLNELRNLLRFQLTGQSGGYRSPNELLAPELMSDMPTMMRLGLHGNRARMGLSGEMVQLPDGTLMRTRGPIDFGYAAPFMGGTLDTSASFGPSNAYDLRLMYRRPF
jgi:hypothetical protein